MRLFSFVSLHHLNQQDYQREFLLEPVCIYKLHNPRLSGLSQADVVLRQAWEETSRFIWSF